MQLAKKPQQTTLYTYTFRPLLVDRRQRSFCWHLFILLSSTSRRLMSQKKSTKTFFSPTAAKLNYCFALQLSLGETVSAWIVTMFKPDRTCYSRAPELLVTEKKILTKHHNNVMFTVYMARTYRSWPVFKRNHCPSVRLGFSPVSEAN